jgi:DNA-directed RNA polymerase subunit E'
MYYLNVVEDKIRIPPDMFGSKIEDAAMRMLRDRYEGRIYKDAGIILSVSDVSVLSDGIVIPGDAGAYYSVKFKSLTFLPLVNEVFKADVRDIVEFGAFASIGPFQGLIHVSQIGKDKYFFDKRVKSLSSKTAKRSVKKGDSVLVKVSTVSIKPTSADTKIGLTMRPDGLGNPDWLGIDKERKAKAERKAEKEGKKESEK